MAKFVRTAFVALLITLATAPLAAQDIRPLESGASRQGFWISLGLGAASTELECDGCTGVEKQSFPMGRIALGGTLSPSLRLGVDLFSGQKTDGFFEDDAVTETFGDVTGSLFWYPSASGNFWVQGGLGGRVFQAEASGDKLTGVAGVLVLGLGMHLRVGRNGSISPFIRAAASGEGTLEDEAGNEINTGLKTTYIAGGISYVFH